VKGERRFAIERLAPARERLLEDPHPVLEGLAEALFLGLEHLCHALLVAAKLGIGIAHLLVEILHQAMEERLLLPELIAVADGAANDPAQHVAAAFAAGNDAVDDQERA